MSSLTDSMRYPRTPQMNRRAYWLVGLNLLIPGIAQLLAGNRILARVGLAATFIVWFYGIVLLIQLIFSPDALATLFTNSLFLYFSQGLLLVYGLLWIALTLDSVRLSRLISLTWLARFAVAFMGILALFASSVFIYGSGVLFTTASTLERVFVATAPAQPPKKGRYNIMLLGGDAGPDREGMRPDSLSVISVDAETGDRVFIGLPRDLTWVPFREGTPLAEVYPKGYPPNACGVDSCQLNTIYVEAEVHRRDLWPDAAAKSSGPGFEATKAALEGATGLEIPYYIFINMDAFSGLIDALGGVEIEVEKKVPIGGDENLNGVAEWIMPGKQRMNGYTALWYARSRHGSDDYSRMARQRQIQQAILRQFSPQSFAGGFQKLARVAPDLIKTDLPQSMAPTLMSLLGNKNARTKRLELVPPEVDPLNPDYEQIRTLIEKVLRGE